MKETFRKDCLNINPLKNASNSCLFGQPLATPSLKHATHIMTFNIHSQPVRSLTILIFINKNTLKKPQN